MRFAEVAVDAPAGYDRTFSYSIPQSLALRPGHLVQVPFGSRSLQGVVISLEAVPQVPQTRDILSITSQEPLLTDTHLKLARWISQYYMCSLFDAAAVMLPPGGRARQKTYLTLSPDVTESDIEELSITALQQKILDGLRKRGKVEQERVIKALGEGARASIGRLVDKGILVRSAQRNPAAIGPKFSQQIRLAANARQAMEEWLRDDGNRAPRRAVLVTHLLENDAPLLLTEARQEYGVSVVNTLMSKGWLAKERVH